MIRAGGFDHGDFSIFDLTDIGISDMDHLILAQRLSLIHILTLSVDILPGEGDAEAMVEDIEQKDGIHYLKILGRE